MVAEQINGSERAGKAQLLDGALVANEIKQQVQRDIEQLVLEHDVRPGLAAIRVGDDPASAVNVRSKIRASEEVGIRSELHALAESTTAVEVLDLIGSLNSRGDVDGILVQLPLPSEIDEAGIVEAVDPSKDVDGFHPVNVGYLGLGRPVLVPCTPAGIIELFAYYRIELRGTNACVGGGRQIVGRPMAQLLFQRDAAVTICPSRTPDLQAVARAGAICI